MIYGYSEKQLNEYGLLEMKEITFSTSPEALRKIAFFLNEMANLMDDEGFGKISHRHIQNTISDWDSFYPGKDIIVMSPEK